VVASDRLVTMHVIREHRAHPRSPRRRVTGENGTVTAEAALVLPVIAAFVLALLWLLTIGIAKVQTVDAARDAARVFARGDGTAAAMAAARQSAPQAAHVEVDSSSSGSVTVTVTATAVAPSWLFVALPSPTVGSTATTPIEGSDGAP
jgi:ABC-type molybdate transport system substrate-binding protein